MKSLRLNAMARVHNAKNWTEYCEAVGQNLLSGWSYGGQHYVAGPNVDQLILPQPVSDAIEDPSSQAIIHTIASVNRLGIYTVDSQEALPDWGVGHYDEVQRRLAYVMGFARPDALGRLAKALPPTSILAIYSPKAKVYYGKDVAKRRRNDRIDLTVYQDEEPSASWSTSKKDRKRLTNFGREVLQDIGSSVVGVHGAHVVFFQVLNTTFHDQPNLWSYLSI